MAMQSVNPLDEAAFTELYVQHVEDRKSVV